MAGDRNNTDGDNCTGGIEFFEDVFGDCVRLGKDTRILISDLIGLVSIGCWLCVGAPQIWANCMKISNAGGISKFLLIFWLLGDTFNLIGAVLSHQLKTQIYIAIWYVAADVILCSQYVVFLVKKRQEKKAAAALLAHQASLPSVLCLSGFLMLWAWTVPNVQPTSLDHSRAGRSLLWTEELRVADQQDQDSFFHGPADMAGYIIGCVSAVMYFFSRSLQIRKNYKRKTTLGISRLMFFLTVLGNLTYGTSIILHSPEGMYILQHLPWLLGSLGIIFMDIVIIAQLYYYEGPSRLNFEHLVNEPLVTSEEEAEGIRHYGAIN